MLNWVQLRPGDAGRLLVRLAVLRAGLAVGRPSQPEHVHADRAGRRRGLPLQRRGHGRPERLPGRLSHAGGGRRAYFDTAAVVTVLVLLGQVLELRARGQTPSAIQKLLGLAPKTARVVRPDGA